MDVNDLGGRRMNKQVKVLVIEDDPYIGGRGSIPPPRGRPAGVARDHDTVSVQAARHDPVRVA